MQTTLRLIATIALLLATGTGSASAQSTLDRVKQRDSLSCGVSQGLGGFSLADSAGRWTGFDADVCRALAAAIFNDPNRVRFVPLSAKDRLTTLQAGDIDVLSRTTTWTMGRDVGQGLNFTAVSFYDGQGFLVRQSKGVQSARDLKGASICVSQASTHELNLADYSRMNGLDYKLAAFPTTDEIKSAYEAGHCDAWSGDLSLLSSVRLTLASPGEHRQLPDVISKEPLGPWVRHGDDQWFDLVRWTIFALLDAEELGVTQANVEDMLSSSNPEVRRLLGVEGSFGETLGLTRDWVVRVVKNVGNYGESFERNLGTGSPLNLPRGLNQLWSKGGLQYAPPIR
ncbi:amino acid ABC transporter substrate-binding protein [Azospirillum sp. sgz301742]